MEVVTHRVADAIGEDLAAGAIRVDADDAAYADLLELVQTFSRCDIEGLTERDIGLAIRPYPADPGGVVEAFVLRRDQLALLDEMAATSGLS
jgi:hypothetical protein